MKTQAYPPSSKKEIALQYKKHFDFLGDREGFYEWLCEEFCEENPWDCDGNCLSGEK